MPSNWASRAISRFKPQQTGSPPSTAGQPGAPGGRSRLFWGVAAVGLGLVSQFALTGGQPLLGGLGLAIAAVLFVANMRPYLAQAPTNWDRRQAPPAAGEIEQEPAHQQPRPPLPSGTSDLRGRVAYVRHNWRELTIAEILSGSMPSPPRDPEPTPTAAPPPPEATGSDPGDCSERPPTGRD